MFSNLHANPAGAVKVERTPELRPRGGRALSSAGFLRVHVETLAMRQMLSRICAKPNIFALRVSNTGMGKTGNLKKS